MQRIENWTVVDWCCDAPQTGTSGHVQADERTLGLLFFPPRASGIHVCYVNVCLCALLALDAVQAPAAL